MMRSCMLLSIVLLQTITLHAEQPDVIDIGDRLELFVDRFLIDQMKDTRLKLHAPREQEVV